MGHSSLLSRLVPPAMRRLRFLLILLIVSVLFLCYLVFSTNTSDNSSVRRTKIALEDERRLRRKSQEQSESGSFSLEERSKCKNIYGKVTVFTMYRNSSLQIAYRVAQSSLQCYLKGIEYPFVMIDIDNDERTNKACGHHKDLVFKKHCAAAEYLQDTDWMMVLDADTGVVNPNHCIEEWIDPRVDLIFYERFFNWEIACGNYIARNSNFSLNFLRKYADKEFSQPKKYSGSDQGPLPLLILETVIPDAIQERENCNELWHNSTNYDTFMAYVACCKLALGATRLWPGKVRIYRRAHGWARDWFFTADRWGPSDFMLHGWKLQAIGDNGWESPFEKVPNASECGEGYEGWHWRKNRMVGDMVVKTDIANYERSVGKDFPKVARGLPHLFMPDVRNCYPNCENATNHL